MVKLLEQEARFIQCRLIMAACWLGFHILDVEMAIDDLKEIDKQKRS